jgi:uncharacterized protein (DUF1697 family)
MTLMHTFHLKLMTGHNNHLLTLSERERERARDNLVCNIKQLITIFSPHNNETLCCEYVKELSTLFIREPSSCRNSFFESDMEIDEVNVKVEVCYCDKTLREFHRSYLRQFFSSSSFSSLASTMSETHSQFSLIKNSKCVAK